MPKEQPDHNYSEFMSRSTEDVFLAMMDKIGVKIDFNNRPDESPIWEAAAIRREFSSPPISINCRCSIIPTIKKDQ